MLKKPTIFDYTQIQNCIIYKLKKKNLIYRGFMIEDFDYFNEIDQYLKEHLVTQKISYIFYFFPRNNKLILWIFSRNYNIHEFNLIINEFLSYFSILLKNLSEDILIKSFFVNSFLQHSEIEIIDDFDDEKFELVDQNSNSLFIFKISFKLKTHQTKYCNILKKFLEYTNTAKIQTLIQIKSKNDYVQKVAIIVFFKTLTEKKTLEGYIKSLKISDFLALHKIRLKDFKRMISKKIINNYNQIRLDEVFPYFTRKIDEKIFQPNYLLNSLTKVKEILKHSSKKLKISEYLIINNKNQYIFILNNKTLLKLTQSLLKYYPNCVDFLIISSNSELIQILKNRTSIEKLSKLSLFFYENLQSLMQTILHDTNQDQKSSESPLLIIN
ncbi:MAG: hypothetical protein K9W44_02860 [Candidatus Lokiarchaeota archaeon]|nr:hypothetical protein [Candidatus Harpocratesius repetitus]